MDRKLPVLNPENKAFWQGGSEGLLLIYRCQSCSHWVHPPVPICVKCGSRAVGPEPVSGSGKVYSFTINYQAWVPELSDPYVVAIVELDEQPGLRFVSNIIGCPPKDVAIGMPVKVTFVQCEDIWLPLFERII